MWTAKKLRKAFIEHFESVGHVHWKSSSVSPDDPTLLFTNSGMVQFKKKFLDLALADTPYGQLKRACNYQKCIRAGGKHNDLDDVGKDTYHHTFFEMLGNWSFGDYFKKEAIDYAWSFLIDVLKLDPERIYVSYFHGDPSQNLPSDTETQSLWEKYLPRTRILGFGSKENFWEMGAVGPCGPCSEIHYDRIGNRDASDIVNKDDPDVLEIWNIVFMQYNREEAGLSILPKKHIDTGMGLERVLSILQNERSNYNTDLFKPLFSTIESVLGIGPYTDRLESKSDIAYRVIADHSRTLAISLMDSTMPSNEGKGYTIRKILRRALGFQYMHLKKAPGLLPVLVEQSFREMSTVYETEVPVEKAVEVVREEEKQFTKTLTKGLSILMKMLEEAKAEGKLLSGPDAFILYDRYGFPIDLTVAVAEQEGAGVDAEGFKKAQEAAKALSKSAQQVSADLHLTVHDISALDRKTEKTATDESEKYKAKAISAKVVGVKTGGELVKMEEFAEIAVDGECGIILDKTSFYSEAGGQEGDAGRILFMSSDREKDGLHSEVSGMSIKDSSGIAEGKTVGMLTVSDTKKYGRYVMHIGRMEGRISDNAICEVDKSRRNKLAHAHTATHLLNYALTKVLSRPGDTQEIKQCGSLVSEDALRFDFHWAQPLTKKEISLVEKTINKIVENKEAVVVEYMPYTEAVKIEGIRHMKDEEYPKTVRVVKVENKGNTENISENSSVELCGGSHVANTGEIGRVRIMTEASISRGVRRISALCGEKGAEVEETARDLLKIKILPETVQQIRDRLDEVNIPLVEASQLREALEEVQKQQIKERKKHFEAETNRMKSLIGQTDGKNSGLLFECAPFPGTTAQQVNKMVGPMVQIFDKEKREGAIIYESEQEIIINGWVSDGVERMKKALEPMSSVKMGGKSPRFMGSVQGDLKAVRKAVEEAMK
ncbi:alanyl-tRNA synthetase [Nematocida minor]|uniref:alanyl-tRNA synthetase n=1 Tax=Nematocida minor TaxID=1912983 RepID=UPI002221023B|nr:alanyl-tRNA synthetase [Nematocida minor]KAI5190219.1 alanyl-tRNA synthetase [Nematocida minor]